MPIGRKTLQANSADQANQAGKSNPDEPVGEVVDK